MAAPVWVLSVDLQAKTATFQTGMADAAKSARGAFNDIRSGSGEMSTDVGRSMTESRESVILLGEAFGVHLPRGLSSFIAGLGPLNAVLESAFPFAAIIVGAAVLIEHLAKIHEAGEKLTDDEAKFGQAALAAFSSLDEKLLQAGIRSDELHNNHLGALKKQLELIDKQSMGELAQQFGMLAKTADAVFADLKTSWYQYGTGSAGAKHALTEFQNEYEKLLAQGKNAEAADLLKGTKDSAQKVLDLQKQAASTTGHAGGEGEDNRAALLTHEAALNDLKKSGVGFTEKEVQAQQTLVEALGAQQVIADKLAAVKTVDKSNAKTSYNNDAAEKAAAAAKEAADHTSRMGEMAIAAEREQANVSGAIHQASIAERLAADIGLANKEYALQQQTNQALIAALDKSGKDYNLQLKTLQDKAAEETVAHANAVATLQGKAAEDGYKKELTDLETAERAKIGATQQGSAARLAAIQAALTEEESKGLQQTSFYRDLEGQKTEVIRQATEEQNKLRAEAGKEEADNAQKMGELLLAAERQRQALVDSGRQVSIQKQMDEEVKAANQEYAIKLAAIQREAAALNQADQEYLNKLKASQDKETQLTKQHETEISGIKEKAILDRNAKIKAAEEEYENSIANGLTQVIMGHKSFAAVMSSIANQVVTEMLQAALKHIEVNLMTKQSDAEAAAASAYKNGEAIPVAGPVLGPIWAAAAYAGVMAFETGGIVPGYGVGDTVPAMLTPGEAVLPKSLADGLTAAARTGDMGGGTTVTHAPVHIHMQIHALDSAGLDKVLKSNAPVLQKHFENSLRRMNK